MSYKKKTEEFPGSDIVIFIYLCVILGFFPLHYKYQYIDMGEAKYSIFSKSTLVCILFLLIMIMIEILLKVKEEGIAKWKETIKWNVSILDIGVLAYFICTTISFLASSFKEEILWGSVGWNMGYVSQFLLVGVYFIVSRKGKFRELYLWILMFSSAVAFLAAILQRFDVDMLGVYGNLTLYYKIQFLSTMGQSSWYSSFLCTVFPVGLYIFFSTQRKKLRIASGVYSVLAMCSLVTQNTDSAFLSLIGVLVILFYLSFDGEKERIRFYEVLLLTFGSFTLIGIVQRIFADYMIPLDSLSIFMSQGFLSPCICLVSVVAYFLSKKTNRYFLFQVKGKDGKTGPSRFPFWILMGIVAIGGSLILLFIILNTNGFLDSQFGYQSTNNYLLFNDEWGNRRGFAWRYSCEMFAEMPFLQKLIGVGPDAYSFYAKSIPDCAEKMNAFWGDTILTNSHNEYLTKLVNVGILGLFSYLFMLGSAIYLFLKNRKENSILPAFALCTVSYMAHNIFCYEQVCCSPFFYILMGFGGKLICKNLSYKKR